MRHGILPGAGGYLDQDNGIIVLIQIAKHERNERERVNNQKANRKKAKRRR